MRKKQYVFDEICPYIREAGLQKGDSWKSNNRKIYDHQFLYCFTGISYIVIDSEYYEVPQGTLVIIPPNTPHSFWVDELVPTELYWIHCDLFYLEDRECIFNFYNDMNLYINLFGNTPLIKEHIRDNPVFEENYILPHILKVKDQELTEFIFRNIYQSYLKQQPQWQMRCKILFLELLENIINETFSTENPISPNKQYIVGQLKNFIANNYYRKIQVQEICAVTGLNVDYTSRVFKQVTGMKITEYLNKYRISKAKTLMIEKDLKIEEIAYMVGFNNENYFSSIVRKFEGQTPGVLRSKLLETVQKS
ncbi:MAG: AraC family transcriptional regulator [Cellulosilyticaceae bacterium]